MTTWSIRVKHTHTLIEQSCTRRSQLTDFCKPGALALKETVHPEGQTLLSSSHLHVTQKVWFLRKLCFHRMKADGNCCSHKAIIWLQISWSALLSDWQGLSTLSLALRGKASCLIQLLWLRPKPRFVGFWLFVSAICGWSLLEKQQDVLKKPDKRRMKYDI